MALDGAAKSEARNLGEGTCQDLSVELIWPGGHIEIVDVTNGIKI